MEKPCRPTFQKQAAVDGAATPYARHVDLPSVRPLLYVRPDVCPRMIGHGGSLILTTNVAKEILFYGIGETLITWKLIVSTMAA